jgi:hypothetical protein
LARADFNGEDVFPVQAQRRVRLEEARGPVAPEDRGLPPQVPNAHQAVALRRREPEAIEGVGGGNDLEDVGKDGLQLLSIRATLEGHKRMQFTVDRATRRSYIELDELAKMRVDFNGPAYNAARKAFVFKEIPTETPKSA